jgi:hypothetical protein
MSRFQLADGCIRRFERKTTLLHVWDCTGVATKNDGYSPLTKQLRNQNSGTCMDLVKPVMKIKIAYVDMCEQNENQK